MVEEKAPKAEKPKKETKPKIERERKNGATRPKPGSKTVVVWEIADAISAKMKRPALRNEVFDEYTKKVPTGSIGMAGTQYSRWCAFTGAGPALKKFRAEEKAKAEKADAEAKAAKAAKKAEPKPTKEAAPKKAVAKPVAKPAAKKVA